MPRPRLRAMRATPPLPACRGAAKRAPSAQAGGCRRDRDRRACRRATPARRLPSRRPFPRHRARAIRLTEPSFCLGMGDRAVAHRVDAADLERIEPEPLGADVEMGFGGERGLQRAERAERAGRRVVGVDAVGVDLDVGNDIGPGGQDRRLAHRRLRSTGHRRRRRRSCVISSARMRPSRIRPMRSVVREGWRLAVEMIEFLAREHQPHRALASSSPAAPACPGRSCPPCRRSRRRPGS